MITRRGGKWYVRSTDGSKNLGGPYDTKAEAVTRLRQVEYYKHHQANMRDLLGIRAHTEGTFRTEKFGGRDYMVVPVVALVEGVIQGATAEYPELALASEFGKFPAGWNGRPVVMNHPEIVHNNQAIKVSANSPGILEKYQFGFVFNSRLDGTRLLQEAWIDVDRANKLNDDSKAVIQALKAGKTVEVSTGLFTGVHKTPGFLGNERYEAIWEGVVPDHLAFLPEGQFGACSVEDGCGAARQNTRYVTLRANCDGNYDPECGCTTPTKVNEMDPAEHHYLETLAKSKPYGNVSYADPGYQSDGKARYPIDTEAHIRAAWNYINQSKNAGKYTSSQASRIKSKIIAAWKSKIDSAGPPSAQKSNAEGKVAGTMLGLGPTGVPQVDDAGHVTFPRPPGTADTSNMDTGKNKQGKKKATTDRGSYNVASSEFNPDELFQHMLANQGVPAGMLDSDVRQILCDELCEVYDGAYPYVIGFTPDTVVYSVFDSIDQARCTYQASFTIDDSTKEAEIDTANATEVVLTTTITPAVETDTDTADNVSAMAGNPASADNTETSMTTAPKPGETPAATPTTNTAPAGTPAPTTAAPAATETAPIKTQSADEYINSAPPGVREALQSAMRTHEAQKANVIKALAETKRCSFSDAELKGMNLEQLEKLAQLAAVPDYSGLGGPAQAPKANADSFSGFAPPPPRLGDKAASSAPASTATH